MSFLKFTNRQLSVWASLQHFSKEGIDTPLKEWPWGCLSYFFHFDNHIIIGNNPLHDPKFLQIAGSPFLP